VIRIQSQSFLGQPSGGGRVPTAMHASCVPREQIGILKIEFAPRLGFAEF
jgi:hypothetical protein